MKQIISLFLFLLSLVMGQAQVNAPEFLHLSTDKPFYVAGEDLWYSVHFLNPAQRVSKVLYVELFGPKGNLVSAQRLSAEGNIVGGDIVLPAGLSTGYYQLRAYTLWNLGFEPVQIAEYLLPIYEPILPKNVGQGSAEAVLPSVENKGITLSLDHDKLPPRGQLAITTESSTWEGLVSLSVVHESALTGGSFESIDESLTNAESKLGTVRRKSQPGFEPETQVVQSFEIEDHAGNPISSNFIVGFVRQSQTPIQGVAKNGRVDLSLTEIYDTTVIQLFDANPFKGAYLPKVKEVTRSVKAPTPSANLNKPPYSPGVVTYLTEYQQRFQLRRLMNLGAELSPKRSTIARRELTPDLEFPIDDFIPMQSLADFANQAVPPLSVKPFKPKSKRELRVSGYPDPSQSLRLFVPHQNAVNDQNFPQRPPLLMVNGYLTYDFQSVFDMDWEKVVQVDVYNDLARLPFLFGPVGNFGVVAFQTEDGETPASVKGAPNTVNLVGFYPGRPFREARAELRSEDGSRLPDLRPVVYWNPVLSVPAKSSSRTMVTFGDQPGRYLVKAEGMLKDGTPVLATQWVEVAFE